MSNTHARKNNWESKYIIPELRNNDLCGIILRRTATVLSYLQSISGQRIAMQRIKGSHTSANHFS